MNLSIEAYDWWGTQVPTQYRTLESKTIDSSHSESFKRFDNINDENVENLFEEYIKVRVLARLLIKQPLLESGPVPVRNSSVIASKILIRKNAMEFIRPL